jgi:hypothetical protein
MNAYGVGVEDLVICSSVDDDYTGVTKFRTDACLWSQRLFQIPPARNDILEGVLHNFVLPSIKLVGLATLS